MLQGFFLRTKYILYLGWREVINGRLYLSRTCLEFCIILSFLSFYARISRYLFYYFCKYFSGVKKGGVEVGQKGGGDTNAGPHSAGGQEDGPAERRAGQVRAGQLWPDGPQSAPGRRRRRTDWSRRHCFCCHTAPGTPWSPPDSRPAPAPSNQTDPLSLVEDLH